MGPPVRTEKPTPEPAGRGRCGPWDGRAPVTIRRYPGMAHGFIRLHNMVDTAANAVRDFAADLRRLCGTGAVKAA